ncbi:FAD-binding oxidoreductase [Futiania mangrovi]|uniref:D-lactate dehydrogenase (cytochrome) n=1 Tax=Futiania mangrovi TaxID=2959716 RepID=A0A9J6P7Q7_9PROT|nr:FAD-linked oxidase C-terminal domain-containing protein [Futiania mangrovii]MCP1334972.1 FAD-binding protein [Futiania mangrovii]
MSVLSDPGTECLAELAALLGGRMTQNAAIRERHGTDESFHPTAAPDAVVFPRTTEEVAEIVRICARHGTPVIPYGTGTSLEGHIAALRGGISIDLGQMDRILRVGAEDMDCTVEAGVTRKQLNAYLRDTGLFFPIDPGADASLGGMTATRASGTNAVRYGTMRENVLGVTAVLASGKIVHTARRARKSSAGYDLTRLFVGSEGTLGVITEVTLRLYPQPEAVAAGVCPFQDMEGAVNAVITTIQMGLPVARIELLDEVQLASVNRYAGFDYKVAPTLFLEFHGTDAWVKEQSERFGEIARDFGGGPFRWATEQEERSALWDARHKAWYANQALKPGSRGWATDVCVPISRLAECILETKLDIEESGLVAPLVGHVGDGNFHLSILVNPDDPEELERAEALNDRLVRRALAMDGTCTGEHGVGYGKMGYLREELPDAVPVMAAIKRALDPQGIMNPGKIVPSEP